MPLNPTQKETKETKQANPNPDDEDKKQEESEKDFGEYDANAIVRDKKIERKNCK